MKTILKEREREREREIKNYENMQERGLPLTIEDTDLETTADRYSRAVLGKATKNGHIASASLGRLINHRILHPQRSNWPVPIPGSTYMKGQRNATCGSRAPTGVDVEAYLGGDEP